MKKKVINDSFSEEMIAEIQRDHMERQHKGRKPLFVKGRYGKKYDCHICGNCAKTIKIIDNWCWNCGYKIKWDGIRCLTGVEEL